jgi:hypothetical protein
MEDFIYQVNPDKTVLLFGSGASVPSGAPGVKDLIMHYAEKYDLDSSLSLSEITFLAEKRPAGER